MGYWKRFYGTGQRPPRGANSGGDSFTVTIDPESINIEQACADIAKQYGKKPVQKVMREGVKPFLKEVRTSLPAGLKPAAKTVGTSNFKKIPAITAGIQLKKAFVILRDGRTYDAYYPLYWANFGTLEMRDPDHRFTRNRRGKSKTWQGGIRPRRFLQNSIDRTRSNVVANISDGLKRIVLEYVEQESR